MNTPNSRADLSLCMIVKNEADNLRDCLANVREVAEQIVIVDTGSTDGTVRIAEELGAEVYPVAWNDDFAEARNASIEHASGDWILWMDADERLEPDQIPFLIECLVPVSGTLCYRVPIRSSIGGGGYHDSDAHRLFTNHRGVQFTGRIHEQIAPSIRKLNGRERHAPFRLLHGGYDPGALGMEAKRKRNRKLLQKCLSEEPENAYYHFTLAQNYSSTEEEESALPHYDRAIELDRFNLRMKVSLLNCAAQTCFRLGMDNRASTLAERSLKIEPMQCGALYVLYRIAERRDGEGTIDLLNRLLDNAVYLADNPKQISTDTIPPVHQIQRTLGSAYLAAGNKKDAFRQYLNSWENSPGDHIVLGRVLELGSELGDLDRVRDILQNYVSSNDDPEILDLLGTVHIRLQEFEQALQVYTRLAGRSPDNSHIIKRLAGLYAKTGRKREAENLLVALNTKRSNSEGG